MNWELFYLINKSWIDLHAIAFVYSVAFMMLIFTFSIVKDDNIFLPEQ